jgi:acyl dehydratase
MSQVLKTASKQVTFDTIMKYADVTNDYNPIHVDKDFAAKSPMKGIIAHGTMSVALIWQALGATLGPDVLNRTTLDIRFVKPVRIDDVVTGGGVLKDASNDVYDVWVKNQSGEINITGIATIRRR